jgi:hypothetical protein
MKWFKSLSEPMKIAFISGIFIVVAAIVGSVVTGIFTLESKTPSPTTIFPTRTSQITATYTTTVPQSTATPTATQIPSPTFKPTQTSSTSPPNPAQITNNNPTFSDSLQSQDKNNWSIDTECSFSGGAYHISVPNWFFAWCIEQRIDFSNFLYQVQITIAKGDNGGIVFREDYANSIFYYFYIGQDGSYNLFLYKGIKGQHGVLLQTGHSSAINTGLNRTNLIAVLASSNNMYLYINNHFVTNISDSTSRSGLIGVIALPNNNPTEVVANNIQVWNL